MYANDAVAGSDELYWADGNAAPPVLLIDEATEAITEALHRMRSGSMLEQRDMAAAGVGLSDLFGGLHQLVELMTTSVSQDPATDAQGLQQRLDMLQVMMLLAQQVAEKMQYGGAAGNTTCHNERIERFSNCTPLRTLWRGSSNRPPISREVRAG